MHILTCWAKCYTEYMNIFKKGLGVFAVFLVVGLLIGAGKVEANGPQYENQPYGCGFGQSSMVPGSVTQGTGGTFTATFSVKFGDGNCPAASNPERPATFDFSGTNVSGITAVGDPSTDPSIDPTPLGMSSPSILSQSCTYDSDLSTNDCVTTFSVSNSASAGTYYFCGFVDGGYVPTKGPGYNGSASCKSFTISAPVGAPSCSASSASIQTGNTDTFTASGGSGSYSSWSISPTSGVSSSTGSGSSYAPTFGTAGSYTATVTDSNGKSGSCSMTVTAPLPGVLAETEAASGNIADDISSPTTPHSMSVYNNGASLISANGWYCSINGDLRANGMDSPACLGSTPALSPISSGGSLYGITYNFHHAKVLKVGSGNPILGSVVFSCANSGGCQGQPDVNYSLQYFVPGPTATLSSGGSVASGGQPVLTWTASNYNTSANEGSAVCINGQCANIATACASVGVGNPCTGTMNMPAISSPTTYTLTVHGLSDVDNNSDNFATANASVSISAKTVTSVVPTCPATVAVGGVGTCTAVVHYSDGSSDANVSWQVSGAPGSVGSISGNPGAYVAPVGPNPSVPVIATSNYDGKTQGTTNIAVTSSGGSAGLSVAPLNLNYSMFAGGVDPTSQNIKITNTGSANLSWSVPATTINGAAINASPSSGTTAPGGTATVAVSINGASGLSVGSHNSSITVNGAGTSQPVAVTLTVNPVGCPTNPVMLDSSSITIGGTTNAHAPAGYSGGIFSSGNSTIASISNSTVTGIATGNTTISGSGWNYGLASNCSLTAVAIAVTPAACTNPTYNSGTSGFSPYSGGPAAGTITVMSGQTFYAFVDYGNTTLDSILTPYSAGAGGCSATGAWVGTAKVFSCVAPSTAGNYTYTTGLNAGTTSNSCVAQIQLGLSGGLKVSGGSGLTPSANFSITDTTLGITVNSASQTGHFKVGDNFTESITSSNIPAGTTFQYCSNGTCTGSPSQNVSSAGVWSLSGTFGMASSLRTDSAQFSTLSPVYNTNSVSYDVTTGLSGGAFSCTVSANPLSVTSGHTAQISWQTSSATASNCTASGDWTGTYSGSNATKTSTSKPLTANATFSMSCVNPVSNTTVACTSASVLVSSGGSTPSCSALPFTAALDSTTGKATVSFSSAGGNGTYAWTVPGADNPGPFSTPSISTTFSATGTFNADLFSGSLATCPVTIQPAPGVSSGTPDFIISDFHLTDAYGNPTTQFATGQPIYPAFTVKNNSGAIVDSTNVGFMLTSFYSNSPSPVPAMTPSNVYVWAGIYPTVFSAYQSTAYSAYVDDITWTYEASSFESNQWSMGAPGSYTARAFVNSWENVPETDYSNNQATAAYTVFPSTVDAPTVTCTPLTVPLNNTSLCTATVTGTGNFNPDVTWTVDGVVGGNGVVGTLVRTGVDTALYTAPANLPSTYGLTNIANVIATSIQNLSKIGYQILTITAPTCSAWTNNPTANIDQPTDAATISGTVNVQGWAIDNALTVEGAISSVHVLVDGVDVGTAMPYQRMDVCAAYPGRVGCPNVGYQYSLDTTTLTNKAHTISFRATDSDCPTHTTQFDRQVTVNNIAVTSVVVTPNPATVQVGKTQQFNAVVNGPSSPSQAVTWSVTGGGTINSSGLYTAPGSVSGGPVTVMATSVQDPTVSGNASVTIVTAPPACSLWTGSPSAFIDTPTNGQLITGPITFTGWALDNANGIEGPIANVRVLVDGVDVGPATKYQRPDVCAQYPSVDCPNVGYQYDFNPSGFSNTAHTISFRATDSDCPTPHVVQVDRSITVNNVAACTALTIKPSTSGFSTSVSGPAQSSLSITAGAPFYAFVDYGSADIDSIKSPAPTVSAFGSYCTFQKFSGTVAVFGCTNPTPGAYTYATGLNAGTLSNSCAATDQVGGTNGLVVTALGSAHIVLTPPAATFSGVSGGATPAAQDLVVQDLGTADLAWTAATDQGWCHVTPASGNVPTGGGTDLTVSVDAPTNIGSFACHVIVSGSGADNSPQDETVTYNVTGGTGSAHIVLTPTSDSFAGVVGGPTPAAKTLVIQDLGTADLAWMAAPDQSWCHVSPNAGTVPTGGGVAVSVSVDSPSIVGNGLFACNINVSGAGADNSPAEAITYNVSGGTPAPTLNFSVNPPSVVFGNQALATWQSTNANSCTAVASPAEGDWVGSVPTSNAGGIPVTPILVGVTTEAYSLTCTGAGGSVTKESDLSVLPPPPVTCPVFEATPSSIVVPQHSILSWQCSNAFACTINGSPVGGNQNNGTLPVAPTSTTPYTLQCSGPGGWGSANASVLVTVTGSNLHETNP